MKYKNSIVFVPEDEEEEEEEVPFICFSISRDELTGIGTLLLLFKALRDNGMPNILDEPLR